MEREHFDELTSKAISSFFKNEFIEFNTNQVKALFSDFLFQYVKSRKFHDPWTGLIFAGYGEDEIYPIVISSKISGVFDNKIRFYTDDVEEINDFNNGSIMPFAQRDVIDTLISGISPEIYRTISATFNRFLKDYNQHFINLLQDKEPELAEKIKDINVKDLRSEFMDKIDDLKRIKHISPTVKTVSILSKEDLAEMAESLIYLTYLKRRISSDEESVGGPVDVAIISKGDGFIWIKRKHYFEEKYNPSFNQKYFKF